MPGQFDTTIWPPTPIPESTKKLIARLFDLCDTNDSTNGVNLAEEVFTADGQFLTANGGFEGKDGKSVCLVWHWFCPARSQRVFRGPLKRLPPFSEIVSS